MPDIVEITSLEEPGPYMFADLTGARREKREGLFIAEGLKVTENALNAGCVPAAILTERKHIGGKAAGLIARCGDIPVYTGDSEVLAELTGFALTRGFLCAMRRPELPSPESVCRDARRVAVLDGVGDAANIGSIFRNAAALGMDAVLLTPSCCDPLHRRAVRVSMGAVFQVPWTYLCDRAEDWPLRGMEWLKAQGFQTAAFALTGQSVSLEDPLLKREPKLAVLLGSEGDGLSPEVIARCAYCVRIPMFHGTDSLNVAAASAVAFWELAAKEHLQNDNEV